MRGPIVGLAMGLALLARLPRLPANSEPPSPPTSSPTPPRPLPMLPTMARVRVESARDRVLIIEEIRLPRGDWKVGNLDLYLAFGAPGPPIAVDARLLEPGSSETRPDDAGEPVTIQQAIRSGVTVPVVFGRRQMAGMTVVVKDSQLRRAFGSSDIALLRVRTLLRPISAGDDGERDVVVRLGTAEGLPITLERVEVASLDKPPNVSRAQAKLCGPEADPWPLSVVLLPKPMTPNGESFRGSRSDVAATILPSLAVRHASDDLCIRWWAVP